MKFSATVWNDAGLLRQYTYEQYGRSYYGMGLSGEAFARMVKMAKRLAKLVGSSLTQVIDIDMKADWEYDVS